MPAGRAIGAALGGALIGALAGVPLGFALALLGHYTLVPTHMWSSDLPLYAMWVAFAAPFVLIGARHGAAPTPLTRRLVRGATGFGLGFLAGAAVSVALAVAAAAILGISQREGAYAMGVAFVLTPLGGLVGGVIGAAWRLSRG